MCSDAFKCIVIGSIKIWCEEKGQKGANLADLHVGNQWFEHNNINLS